MISINVKKQVGLVGLLLSQSFGFSFSAEFATGSIFPAKIMSLTFILGPAKSDIYFVSNFVPCSAQSRGRGGGYCLR